MTVAETTVAEIWRYPIKTMAGEQLEQAVLGSLGIAGDRIVHVEDRRGHVVTARSHPGFLGLRATLGADGEPLVDGVPWQDHRVAAQVAALGGRGAQLVANQGAERFDVLPLLVATDGAIAAFGHDRRRLRPNLVIAGVPGLGERDWPGNVLCIGEVRIGIQDLRKRCIMTSFDPDTLAQDKQITRGIYQHLNGELALNCFVIQGGTVCVGSEVELIPGRADSDW